MKNENPPCPCGSGEKYGACCRKFHRGEEPPDAGKLMRSRFSAYAMGEPAYLWRTLHPDHPERKQTEAEHTAMVRRSKQRMKYVRLQVREEQPGAEPDSAYVTFHAELFEAGKDRSFTEKSFFRKTDEGWRYLSGVLNPKV